MLGNPFSFHGRRGRLSYLLTSLLQAVVSFIVSASLGSDEINFFQGLIVLCLWGGVFWCSFAISAQRLHDIGASGWWSLLMLVPIVNLVVAILLVFAPGQRFDNLYGPMPLPQRPPAVPA